MQEVEAGDLGASAHIAGEVTDELTSEGRDEGGRERAVVRRVLDRGAGRRHRKVARLVHRHVLVRIAVDGELVVVVADRKVEALSPPRQLGRVLPPSSGMLGDGVLKALD